MDRLCWLCFVSPQCLAQWVPVYVSSRNSFHKHIYIHREVPTHERLWRISVPTSELSVWTHWLQLLPPPLSCDALAYVTIGHVMNKPLPQQVPTNIRHQHPAASLSIITLIPGVQKRSLHEVRKNKMECVTNDGLQMTEAPCSAG